MTRRSFALGAAAPLLLGAVLTTGGAGAAQASCGLQSHSAAFREEERKFSDYERARKFLQRM